MEEMGNSHVRRYSSVHKDSLIPVFQSSQVQFRAEVFISHVSSLATDPELMSPI